MVSPFAWVSKNVNIAQGSIIYPGCSINYACHIEEFVVMNMNCAIGHDCHIGAFSSLAPGVNFGGNTRIGKGCDVGIGVATKQQVDIGDYSIIGGQAMVVRNVEKKSTIAGVPGKPIINS